MNKISDLKVGDKVYDKNHGEHIVYDKGYFYSSFKKIGLIFTKNGENICEYEIDWQKTNELNNKEMDKLIIEAPTGMGWYRENDTIKFRNIENKLPMSVEEIPNRKGFYIDSSSKILCGGSKGKNNISTYERAEAFLALMQLVKLRDAWNGDWKADWKDSGENKFTISVCENKIIYLWYWSEYHVLHFKSEQLRDQFAEQFKDLIETAKELL